MFRTSWLPPAPDPHSLMVFPRFDGGWHIEQGDPGSKFLRENDAFESDVVEVRGTCWLVYFAEPPTTDQRCTGLKAAQAWLAERQW